MKTMRAARGRGHSTSRSPALHRAAAASVGMHHYELVDVAPEHLEDALERLLSAGLNGWNVTAPHKRAVWRWVPAATSLAARLHAVNTVVVDSDGSVVGHNTDVIGFQSLLGKWDGQRAVVLGAGGAAGAVVDVLAGRNTDLEIINRSQERAESLRDRLAEKATVSGMEVLAERLEGADLLVNAIGREL